MMNWGRAIILVFVLFASGIGYLVYRATQTEFDLVEDDYYEQELNYQQHIDQRNKAIKMGVELSISINENTLRLGLTNIHQAITSWNVLFYDPTNRANDRNFKLASSDSAQWFIPLEKLNQSAVQKKSYTIKLDWVMDGDTFRTEKNWY